MWEGENRRMWEGIRRDLEIVGGRRRCKDGYQKQKLWLEVVEVKREQGAEKGRKEKRQDKCGGGLGYGNCFDVPIPDRWICFTSATDK